MFHTFFKIALLGALTASLSLADDFLARATNGALSDNSVGVKKLTADEASKVVGGYKIGILDNRTKYKPIPNQVWAIALPDVQNELGWSVVGDDLNLQQTMKNDKGLCPIGVTNCYLNEKTKTHKWQSRQRLLDYQQALQALDGSNYLYTGLAYSVTRHIGYSRTGKFVYFTYGVATYNRLNGKMRNINSSSVLNNNRIIKEISASHKEAMENVLGGWSVQK